MFTNFDFDAVSGNADALLRDMTRPASVGEKINVHVIPANIEPTPDFEAMRLLVAGNKRPNRDLDGDDRAEK